MADGPHQPDATNRLPAGVGDDHLPLQPDEFRPDPEFLRANLARIKQSMAPSPTMVLLAGVPLFIAGVVAAIAREPVIAWPMIIVGLVAIVVGAVRLRHPVWGAVPGIVGVRWIKPRREGGFMVNGFLCFTEDALDEVDFVQQVVQIVRANPDAWDQVDEHVELKPISVPLPDGALPEGCHHRDLQILPALILLRVIDERSGAVQTAGFVLGRLFPAGGLFAHALTSKDRVAVAALTPVPPVWWNATCARAAMLEYREPRRDDHRRTVPAR